MLSGRDEDAIRTGEEAIAMALELGSDDIRVHALASVGPAKANAGNRPAGRADLEEALEIGNRLGSAEVLRVYINLAAVLSNIDLREGRRLHLEGMELATRLGHAPAARFLQGELGTDAWFAGDWDELVRIADEFEADEAAGSPHYLLGILLSARGAVRIVRGDLERGRADVERGVELGRQRKDPQALAPALGFAVGAAHELGRRDEALAYVEELLADPALYGTGLAPEVARAAVDLGRAEEALSGIDEARSIWHRASAAILRGEFAVAVELYAEVGAVPEEARARLWLAEQLVADGHRFEADEQLEHALAFWRSVGAVRYIAEAEALRAQAETA
jgi:tetratricopeptide (TPR) repeat protein